MAVNPTSNTALPRRWLILGGVLLASTLTGVLIAVLLHRTSGTPAAAAGGATAPPASWAAGQRPAPGFRLADQTGRRVSLAEYRGRSVIVTFIDPLCTNFCPLEAHQLNALVRGMPPASRPAILAVSTNVYGNARRNLFHDEAKWHLVPQWRWAVGSPRLLARVWRSYQIGVRVATRKVHGATVHNVSHTEAAYLIDPRGYERALFLWPFTAKDLLAALHRIAPPRS